MDKKIIALFSIFTFAVIGIAIFVVGSGNPKAELQKTKGAKILTTITSKSAGNIPYSGPDLIESFPIKNVGDKNLEIANIATSCMCTNAYLKQGSNKSEEFGMKGMSAPSAWKGIIKPGETAEIVADFNPSYHGPSGIGPIQRTVSFETNDPDNPYVEFNFDGTVIK